MSNNGFKPSVPRGGSEKKAAGFLLSMVFAAILTLGGCSKGSNGLPNNFKDLSTADKMEVLMEKLPADSVARYVCNSAMGKIYNSRIELQEAMAYAYEHYCEDDQVAFALAMNEYEAGLPLGERVRFSKLTNLNDPDVFAYELGLEYVGTIRAEGKTPEQVKSELDSLRRECKNDPDFYKRFMKGFKTALEYDRFHDLDDRIYTQFISYPETIK